MNRLINKILKYLNENEGKKILIDINSKISSEDILDLALKFNKKKVIDKKVLINLDRSAQYIEVIIALWINGNTVIPTNKNWPKKYINEIMNSCKADFLINKNYYSVLNKAKIKLTNLSFTKKIDFFKNLGSKNKTPYIIFTSGTTSKQKGVIISEKNYLSYIKWTSEEFKLYKNLKSLILTSELNFDITFGDIAFALFSNCKIIVAKNNSNIFEIIQLIDQYKIEVMYTVPNLFKLLFLVLKKYKINKSIKLFISGGEVLNKKICVDAKKLFPKSNFYNVYGPTECTINITSYRVNLNQLKNKRIVPIGKVFPHLHWQILPSELDKNVGELIVSGNQLMDGYVNKEYKFLKIKNRKYYNTGDLVKTEKGLIYWLSRNDNMVKKKGLRIYTSEIDEIVETNNNNLISKTILIDSDLILFYLGNVNKNKILNCIQKNLPPYMHPLKIIKVKEFPIGPTGKVDLNKLKKSYASEKS